MKLSQKAKNAFMIGSLCSTSYLAVYYARNILGAVTPHMIESGYTTEYIGRVSSMYFIFYAVGQLINGAIGDKIKAKYMISFGLLFAAITNALFLRLSSAPDAALYVYAMTGFGLSMIYAPMTKVVAENTDPVHATRCSLGYTFASFFGSPLAGVAAAVMVWQSVFISGSAALAVMSVICFGCFAVLEKKGIVKYNQYNRKKEKGGGIKVLIKHRIIKFTIISILTGVVRTTVVFWLPTYVSQYLGFSADTSAMIFTVTTSIISMSAFVAVFVYERLNRNMDLTILLAFILSAVSFGLVYIVQNPVTNIIMLTVAIMASNCAASMLWSRYCPSLRDTGMTSTATGFLDFVSYMAASASSTIFANAIDAIGWGNLILVWSGLMVCGVVTSLPYDKILKRS